MGFFDDLFDDLTGRRARKQQEEILATFDDAIKRRRADIQSRLRTAEGGALANLIGRGLGGPQQLARAQGLLEAQAGRLEETELVPLLQQRAQAISQFDTSPSPLFQIGGSLLGSFLGPFGSAVGGGIGDLLGGLFGGGGADFGGPTAFGFGPGGSGTFLHGGELFPILGQAERQARLQQ